MLNPNETSNHDGLLKAVGTSCMREAQDRLKSRSFGAGLCPPVEVFFFLNDDIDDSMRLD